MSDYKQHRYAYDKAVPGHPAKKFKCPQCGHKRYVQFYDFQTNQYLPEHFGKCDREDNCGYVNTPWEWLKENGQNDAQNYRIEVNYMEPVKARIVEVEKHILESTLTAYEHNNFYLYLRSIFGDQTAQDLAALYFIGTAKAQGTIFWQLDQLYRIRTAQKIHYKPDGHRDKSFNPPSQRLFTVDKGYVPCLFGEHLIWDAPKNALFAVVEAEKTAIIASVYYPQWKGRPLVWLACCGMHGFTDDKLHALAGQDVLLVPDFAFTARATWGCELMRKKLNEVSGKIEVNPEGEIDYDYVSIKAKLVQRGCSVEFWDPYPEIEDGSDLADYIVNQPPPVFYERPDFASLTLPVEGQKRDGSGVEASKEVPKADFRAIGQAIEARDAPKQKSWRERATEMIYAKYGFQIGGDKFDEILPKLEGQLRIADDPRTKMLMERFNLQADLKF